MHCKGDILGIASEATYGACATIHLNEDTKKIEVETNMVRNLSLVELNFDSTREAPLIKNQSDQVIKKYSFSPSSSHVS